MFDDQMTERLVEMAFSPLDMVITWLMNCHIEIVHREENTVTVRNPRLDPPMVTAIDGLTDPNTRAVCLGFLFAGAYWPSVFPELQERINQEWKKGRKNHSAKTTEIEDPIQMTLFTAENGEG